MSRQVQSGVSASGSRRATPVRQHSFHPTLTTVRLRVLTQSEPLRSPHAECQHALSRVARATPE
jgi:hypothetical protein